VLGCRKVLGLNKLKLKILRQPTTQPLGRGTHETERILEQAHITAEALLDRLRTDHQCTGWRSGPWNVIDNAGTGARLPRRRVLGSGSAGRDRHGRGAAGSCHVAR